MSRKSTARKAPAKTESKAPVEAPVHIKFVPPTPMAHINASRFSELTGVPSVVFLIGAMVLTEYGAKAKAEHNIFNLRHGSDSDYRKTPEGYNMYSIDQDSYEEFGHIAARAGINRDAISWQTKAAELIGIPEPAFRKLADMFA